TEHPRDRAPDEPDATKLAARSVCSGNTLLRVFSVERVVFQFRADGPKRQYQIRRVRAQCVERPFGAKCRSRRAVGSGDTDSLFAIRRRRASRCVDHSRIAGAPAVSENFGRGAQTASSVLLRAIHARRRTYGCAAYGAGDCLSDPRKTAPAIRVE